MLFETLVEAADELEKIADSITAWLGSGLIIATR